MNGIKRIWNRLHKSEQGLTLVEVLMATLILSIVIVGTVALFAKGGMLAEGLKQQSVVNNALNERMEEIRDMAYSSITALGSTFTADGFSQLNNATGAQNIDDPFTDADIKRVTLTISWTGPQGRALNKSLSAYVTNDGINKQ